MNSGKPGTMFYFDILPALEKLSAEKVGTLFLVSMRYAQTGEAPAFDDVVLDFAWALIKPGIDRDSRRYTDKRARGDWLTYCRRCKQEGVEPMDFETWREHTDNGTFQSDTDTLPTTSTTTTTAPTTSTTSNMGANKPPTPAPARRKYGTYGWVRLTDDEHSRLERDLGAGELARCISYVDESAQGNGNKNRWKDWNLVIRRCSREGWGRNRQQGSDKNRLRTDADYSGGGDFFDTGGGK